MDHDQDQDQDQDQGQGASQVNPTRSYECNFCKRGFSNAQALGGHMNIHRKDKAKLRQQSSNQTQPSNLEGKSGEEEPSKPNLINLNVSAASSRDEIHHMRQQLPLFAEKPTSSETLPQKPQPQGQIHTTEEEALLLSGQASSSELLDLELRLGGPEPVLDSSATPMGTRKFF